MAAVTTFNRAGGTVILITHNMRLVAEYASRAVVMAGGQVVFDATPRTRFSSAGRFWHVPNWPRRRSCGWPSGWRRSG